MNRQPARVHLPMSQTKQQLLSSEEFSVHMPMQAPSRPINVLLPPLTSSNDIDLQLYATIAIVVKDLVQSWYGKITPDQGFVEEVVRIVAHCTTQLESRLRSVDLEGLVVHELPELVEGHINGE